MEGRCRSNFEEGKQDHFSETLESLTVCSLHVTPRVCVASRLRWKLNEGVDCLLGWISAHALLQYEERAACTTINRVDGPCSHRY